MGLLVVQGTIDLAQFWSNGGESDGDTTHVAVKEVTFNDKPTKIFDGAYVKGRGKSDVIKKGAVTVRWQGIDSPELHYIPQVKGTHVAEAHNFRQHYGQAATRALLGLLKDLAGGAATIDARVTSQVHHPNDVFDTYGRMIGTVIVKGRDLNHWMVEEGWAFPTFYSSMSAEEIIPLREAAQKAAMTKRGIWKEFEGLVRKLTIDRGELIVITGPIYADDDGKIPESLARPAPNPSLCAASYKAGKSPKDNPSIIAFDVETSIDASGKVATIAKGKASCDPMP